MIGHSAVALMLFAVGVVTKLTVVSVLSVILLLAPAFGKINGIGWREFSPRVVGVCLIIVVVALVCWNA